MKGSQDATQVIERAGVEVIRVPRGAKARLYRLGAAGLFVGIVATPLVATATLQTAQVGSDLTTGRSAEVFGYAVKLTEDGNRVAISGQRRSDSSKGTVQVYDWNGSSWSQVGTDIVGSSANIEWGMTIAMTRTGHRLAAASTKVSGGVNDERGAFGVYFYDADSGDWSQMGSTIVGQFPRMHSGTGLALSDDGNRVAVGADVYDGTSNNGSYLGYRGFVQVYEWNGSSWDSVGSPIIGESAKAGGNTFGDMAGAEVALSGDGSRLAVAEPGYNAGSRLGRVRIFDWNGSGWDLVGTINGKVTGENFGWGLNISQDGSRVAAGAPSSSSFTGAVRVYEQQSSTWIQIGEDVPGASVNDYFGGELSLSSDGSRFAVGSDEHSPNGHVRLFEQVGDAWVQVGSDIDGDVSGGMFGYSVALSGDGTRIAAGSPGVSSLAGKAQVFGFYTEPGQPSGVTGVGGNGQVTLSWSAPADDGGDDISGYKIESSVDNGSSWVVQVADTGNGLTSAGVTGLTNNVEYLFRVSAINSAGSSDASVASAVVVPAEPPGAPTGVSGVAGIGEVEVSWTSPTNTGDPALSSYRVTASPGGATCTSTSLSCTVIGLTEGATYSFTVVAVSPAAESASSGPSGAITVLTTPITPVAPPAPTAPTTPVVQPLPTPSGPMMTLDEDTPEMRAGTGEVREGDDWDQVKQDSSMIDVELVRVENSVVLQPTVDVGEQLNPEDEFEIRLSGQCSGADCSVETVASEEGETREIMRLQTIDGVAIAVGEGFESGTEVQLWMFSNPENLGRATVRPDGTFEAQISLEIVPEGEHTLQVNGVTKDNRARSANIGVMLEGPEPASLPVTGSEPHALQFALVVGGVGLLTMLLVSRRREPC